MGNAVEYYGIRLSADNMIFPAEILLFCSFCFAQECVIFFVPLAVTFTTKGMKEISQSITKFSQCEKPYLVAFLLNTSFLILSIIFVLIQ